LFCHSPSCFCELSIAAELHTGVVSTLLESATRALGADVRTRKRLLRSRVASLASFAALGAVRQAAWQQDAVPVSVLIGSSRGATDVLEREHRSFIERGCLNSQTSPTTTLGNLSSVVAAELGRVTLTAELSSACSTSSQALVLGLAWLKAGFGRRCLVGGAEAPLTAFTVAQMRAVGLLVRDRALDPPCRPCADAGGSGLALGEGSCVLALEVLSKARAAQRSGVVAVTGMGTSVESPPSPTGITPEGDAFYGAMTAALQMHGAEVDCVVMHAPGTQKGDRAELRALQRVFGEKVPPLVSNKWKLGHTFGAAGALNVELGYQLLQGARVCPPAYPSALGACGRVRTGLVNAAGFGGAGVSIVQSQPRL